MLLVEIHQTYLKELHQYHIYCKNSSVLSIVRCIRDKVLIENGTHIYLEVNAAWANVKGVGTKSKPSLKKFNTMWTGVMKHVA